MRVRHCMLMAEKAARNAHPATVIYLGANPIIPAAEARAARKGAQRRYATIAPAAQVAGWQTFRKKSCLLSHLYQARKVTPPIGVSRQAEETGRTLIPAFARCEHIDTSSTTFWAQRALILFSSKVRLLMAVAPPHGWAINFIP